MAKTTKKQQSQQVNTDVPFDMNSTKIKTIIPINCTFTALVPLANLIPSQGELKVSKGESLEKLEASFDKHGFIKPFALWHDTTKKEDTCEMLDGHQRRKLLLRMAAKGKGTKDLMIPVIYSMAKTKKEAMEILLHLVESTGDITQKGLLEFTDKFQFNLEDVAAKMSLKSPALEAAKKKLQEKATTELQRNPIYPIQPHFTEKYGAVTIFFENEMDEVWLLNLLKLVKTKDYNSSFVAQNRVIKVQDLQKALEEREKQLLNSQNPEDAK